MSYLIGSLLERALAYGLKNEYANLGFSNPNEAAKNIYIMFFKNLGSLENKEYYAARFAAKEAVFKAISESLNDKYNWSIVPTLNCDADT